MVNIPCNTTLKDGIFQEKLKDRSNNYVSTEQEIGTTSKCDFDLWCTHLGAVHDTSLCQLNFQNAVKQA